MRPRVTAVREAGAAFLLGTLLALVVRRPQDLSTTVPGDAGDPVLVAWIIAWPGHALTSLQSLWSTNAFSPLANTLAFSDPLLGYLPFGLVGEGPGAALVRYNLVLLFTYSLAFAGTWVLVRQLGLGRAAALVAATAFALTRGGRPWPAICRCCRAAASRSSWRCWRAATVWACAAAGRSVPAGSSADG